MGKRRYRRKQRQAIADALNVLFPKMDTMGAHWLVNAGLTEINDALGITLEWDDRIWEFVCEGRSQHLCGGADRKR